MTFATPNNQRNKEPTGSKGLDFTWLVLVVLLEELSSFSSSQSSSHPSSLACWCTPPPRNPWLLTPPTLLWLVKSGAWGASWSQLSVPWLFHASLFQSPPPVCGVFQSLAGAGADGGGGGGKEGSGGSSNWKLRQNVTKIEIWLQIIIPLVTKCTLIKNSQSCSNTLFYKNVIELNKKDEVKNWFTTDT